jgi:hypothetical protein
MARHASWEAGLRLGRVPSLILFSLTFTTTMKAFVDLSSLGWDDFVANAVFFALDIVLLSILVPLLIRRSDRQKWAAARAKIGQMSALHLERTNSAFSSLFTTVRDFAAIFPEAFRNNPDAFTDEGLEKQREILFREFSAAVDRLGKSLDESVSEYLQIVQVLTPSFDSEIAIRTIEFYEASIRPRSLAMAKLYWWIVSGKEDAAVIGVNEKLVILYAESIEKLTVLCASVGHTPELPSDSLVKSMQALASFLRTQLDSGNLPIPVTSSEGSSPQRGAAPVPDQDSAAEPR